MNVGNNSVNATVFNPHVLQERNHSRRDYRKYAIITYVPSSTLLEPFLTAGANFKFQVHTDLTVESANFSQT